MISGENLVCAYCQKRIDHDGDINRYGIIDCENCGKRTHVRRYEVVIWDCYTSEEYEEMTVAEEKHRREFWSLTDETNHEAMD